MTASITAVSAWFNQAAFVGEEASARGATFKMLDWRCKGTGELSGGSPSLAPQAAAAGANSAHLHAFSPCLATAALA